MKGFEVRACGCDCAPNVCLRRSRASYVCVCVCVCVAPAVGAVWQSDDGGSEPGAKIRGSRARAAVSRVSRQIPRTERAG